MAESVYKDLRQRGASPFVVGFFEYQIGRVLNNYWAVVESESCTGCEIYMERCQMHAIQMDDDEVSTVNNDRCIGCGICVTTCPSESITLELKPEG